MRIRVPIILVALISSMASAAIADDEPQWGDLHGRFLFDGTPPKPVRIKVDKDVEVLTEPIFDERLVVNQENRGIANVGVYLIKERDKSLPVHPSYADAESQKVELCNKNGRIDTHITLLRTTQTLSVLNKEAIGHNTKLDTLKNLEFNAVIPAAGKFSKRFEKPESVPIKVGCSIHPWELGYVVLQDHPYMAVTDADGKFEIKNLPIGELTFRVWQERAGFVTKVIQDGAARTWEKGRVKVTIKPRDNDLGEIRLEPKLFERH